VVGLTGVLLADYEPHRTLIAVLSTLVVVLLLPPLKSRIQEGIERLLYRERYSSRKALLRLSQDLNANLDLARVGERLQEEIMAALGVAATAVFLKERDGCFSAVTSRGGAPGTEALRLPADGPLVARRTSRRRAR
jgi:hypothetical protein